MANQAGKTVRSSRGNRGSDTVKKYPGVIEGVSNEAFQSFVQDFYALSAAMQELRGHLAVIANLPHSCYTALLAIAQLQRGAAGVSVNELARHLRLRGSSVTIEVGRLADLGLVAKSGDAEDRRRVLVTLTPKALQLLDEVAPIWEKINGAVFEVLSPADFDLFRRAISRILQQMDPALAMAKFFKTTKNTDI